MRRNGVCAIVTSFEPSASNISGLCKVIAQAESVVVVDNGSRVGTLHLLRDASRTEGFTLIENGENLGVATALNRGVRWAQQKGFQWAALFDQDSIVTDNFIELMLADFDAAAKDRNNVIQIIPRYRDPDTGVDRITTLDRDGGPAVTITSGSFFAMRVFEECG